jgi:hypothetical protein
MPTNFNSTLIKLSTTQFQVGTSLYDATFNDDGSLINITNTKLSVSREYDSGLAIATVGTKAQNITVLSPLPSPITDAVYKAELNMYDASLGLKWTSTAYALVTTQIDIDIADYEVINAFTKLHKLRIEAMRESVDTFFAAGDYANCNLYIDYIEDALVAVEFPNTLEFDSTLQLTNRNTLLVNVPSGQTFTTPLLQNNLTWNVILSSSTSGEVIVSTFAQSGSGSASFDSANIYDLSYYEDGVQWFYVYFWTPANFYGSNALTVITTTIDEQWITFQANYDPTDAIQLQNYEDLKLLFAQLDALKSSVDTEFSAINAIIIEIQDLLALFVVPNIRVTLPSKDNILVEITTNIPNVTYESQKLVLSNCGDLTQEYTLENSFPLNYVDVNKTLNSNDINFGSQYADGVYQAYVSWNTANDMNFGGSGYVLVTTQIDCGIAKIIAQHPTCKALNNRLNEIMTYRRIITESFNNEDYNSTFFYINLCLNLLTKSGCNCGC